MGCKFWLIWKRKKKANVHKFDIPIEDRKLFFDIWMANPTAVKAAEKLANLGIRNGAGNPYSAIWMTLIAETYILHAPEYCRKKMIEHGAKQFQDDKTWLNWLISRAVQRLRRNPVKVYAWAKEHNLLEETKKYDKYLRYKVTPETVVEKSVEVKDIVQEILEKTKPRS